MYQNSVHVEINVP